MNLVYSWSGLGLLGPSASPLCRLMASVVSAFISRLNSMHVSFLMFCFSAVCFFINVSFRAVVSAVSVQSTQFCSSLFCCTVSVSMNKTWPILSVFPALIVHSELKSVHPGFPVAFIF